MFRKNIPLLILAAGDSTRMGSPKGLLEYQGKPWLLEQVGRFENAGGKKFCVVLGKDSGQYKKELSILDDKNSCINPHTERGAFSSLQIGLKKLLEQDSGLDGIFILPIDTPGPSSKIWNQMVGTLSAEVWVVSPAFQGEGGHPLLISSAFAAKLLTYDVSQPDSRLDLIIKKFNLNDSDKKKHVRISVQDPCVKLNLNDPESWRNYL